MSIKIKWMIIPVLFFAGLTELKGATVDFSSTPTGGSTNGFYYWTDGGNWVGGVVPGIADAPRFRYVGHEKAYLSVNYTNSQLSINPGISVEIAGTNTLTLTTYMLMDGLSGGVGSSLTLDGYVHLIILNRARTTVAAAGSTVSVTLNDNSYFNPRYWGFDGTNTTLELTANGNAVYEETVFSSGMANLNAASTFTFNDTSRFSVTNSTAAELDTSWLQYGLKIDLNDKATIVFQTSGSNAADIASLISSGKLLINGSTNAVSGKNYTYDAATGVLEAFQSVLSLQIIQSK